MKRYTWSAALMSSTQRWLLPLCLVLGFLAGARIARAAVTLMYFEAEVQGDGILLMWETGSETNNVGFYLYRSTDPAQRGAMLIFIESTMEVTGDYYDYLDSQVTPGVTYYYRLGALDTNGNIEYYGPVVVMFPSPGMSTPTATPTPSPTALATQTPSFRPTATDTPSPTATATFVALQPSTPTRTPTGASPPTLTPTPTWIAAPGVTPFQEATGTSSPALTLAFTSPLASPTVSPISEMPPASPATAMSSIAVPEPPSPPAEPRAEDSTEVLSTPPSSVALAAAPPPARQIPPRATPSPRPLLSRPADVMLYLAGGSLCGALALVIVAFILWRGLR
ncbi:MAG: hypothetical protein RML36_02635 [Anaerolineae bacterium]|nr:hypothetical protein [Anaerolineae bacterium]MDW8098364.1 hypothetical protein [Anaerolineae bacterium]